MEKYGMCSLLFISMTHSIYLVPAHFSAGGCEVRDLALLTLLSEFHLYPVTLAGLSKLFT